MRRIHATYHANKSLTRHTYLTQVKNCNKKDKRNACLNGSGSVLLSQVVSNQVPSALRGLTSVFGMRTGGSLSPLPPEWLSVSCTLTTA